MVCWEPRKFLLLLFGMLNLNMETIFTVADWPLPNCSGLSSPNAKIQLHSLKFPLKQLQRAGITYRIHRRSTTDFCFKLNRRSEVGWSCTNQINHQPVAATTPTFCRSSCGSNWTAAIFTRRLLLSSYFLHIGSTPSLSRVHMAVFRASSSSSRFA